MTAAISWLDRYFVSGPAYVTYVMPTDGNQTLPDDVQVQVQPLVFVLVTSAVTLIATRDLVISLTTRNVFAFRNTTTGGQSIRIIGTSGTGITIAPGATAQVVSDGTNVVLAESAGAGAPIDANYVVLTANATLTNERTLAGEAGVISVSDGGTGNPVTLALVAGGVAIAKLDNGAACSVLGRSANSSGVRADIAASADGQACQRVAGVVAFGTPIGDHGANDLVTSSTVRIGTAPGTGAASYAATGDLRGKKTFAIKARNSADTGDANVLDWAIGSVAIGDSTNPGYIALRAYSGGVFYHQTGGGDSFTAGYVETVVNTGKFCVGGSAGSYGASTTNAIFFANGVAPTSNPVGGGVLQARAGALRWIGSSGTDTLVAAAEPHCPKCSRDFVVGYENRMLGEKLTVCVPCLVDTLTAAGLSGFVIERTLND